MMKIAITGFMGEIGSRLFKLGYIPLKLDVTEIFSIKDELERVKPDVILHCAGISSVDQCEQDLDTAILVNVRGTNNLCEHATDIGAKVVLLSSDYVFDGKKGNYKEDDEWNPINNYGLTKIGAEAVIRVHGGKIIRISRTFNASSKDLKKYFTSAFNWQTEYVPDFIFRSYCSTDCLVEGLDFYLKHFEDMPDTLNIAGKYSLSYFDFISLLLERYSFPKSMIQPRTEDDLLNHTPRPHRLGLDVSLAQSLGVPLFDIKESLGRMSSE